MKTRIHLLLLTATMLSVAVSPLGAQVVADGATNTLNGGTTIITGDVTVGTNAPFTLLVLTNNALLTNSGFAYIGRNAGANSNAVRLTGANTRWLMPGTLNVGYSGAGNQLVVSNGARVENAAGRLGYTASSSDNEAVVSGSGSLWSNRFELSVGQSGSGNRLVIANGGTVFSSNSVIVGVESGAVNNLLLLSSGALLTNIYDGVLGANTGANSNTAFLSGLNSRWLMGGNMHVGSNGPFNRLVITNGARVRDDYGYLGDSISSSNNVALVTGAGSFWSNRFGLHVGNSGSGNRLVITNGGVVRNLNGVLGLNSDSINNIAVVTGAGSLWTNEAYLYVGYDGAGNQLVVSNGGVVVNFGGRIGFSSSSSNNVAVVTGPGSRWTNDFDLAVGESGSGNELVVANGGVVQGGVFSYVGVASSDNVVVVTGTGSQWTATGIDVGYYFGGGNQLLVSDGGMVNVDLGSIGFHSSNNRAVVTGAGSLWTNGMYLTVGDAGAGNQLLVTDAGVVSSASGTLGIESDGSNNMAVVTGAGSLWTNETDLTVGYAGAGNQLVVTNGGVVSDQNGFLGYNSTSDDNMAVVTGFGSLWMSKSNLYVGDGGSGNQLEVSNGGALRSFSSYVGRNLTSSNNVVVVTGPGSSWTNAFLHIGSDGPGNHLVVSNGGVVNSSFYVGVGYGSASTSSDNMAVVTGAGSLWTADYFYVGSSANGNRVEIRNGGAVRASQTAIGFSFSGNNEVVVTGEGSLWANEQEFFLGIAGSGNQLVVTNGGVVQDHIGALGLHSESSNNVAVVTGTGSLWTNGLDLILGVSSAGNQLVVNNGGMVRAGGLVTLGAAPTATDNNLVAEGGSLASAGLTLGGSGSRNNSITLLSGSSWDLRGGTFTWGTAGLNDTLTIDASSALINIGGLKLDENDTAFYLTNAPGGYSLNGFTTSQLRFKPVLDSVVVGVEGTNVQLTIRDYALADTTGTIGDNAPARNNAVLVTGAGSLWSNSAALKIGNNGSFNQLVINNGGLVASPSGTLGSGSGSDFNLVLINGTNSLWKNNGALTNGGGGAFNQLVISDGGVVRDTTATVGSTGSNNLALITGAGSVWSNSSSLLVGGGGSFNQLVVSNGAVVQNSSGTVGNTGGNNRAMITGAGSVWSNSSSLLVGSFGSFNQVVVNNGGVVRNTAGNVGGNTGANSNLVFVAGPGSQWTNSGDIIIGNAGAFNQLVISNGAAVVNSFGNIGNFGGANGNSVLVTGAGSLWANDNTLGIGLNGSFSQLVVSNGGVVRNRSGTVASSGANSNLVVVTGTGSLWTNSANLILGSAGAFNQLVISDGGMVANSSGTVGNNAGLSGNRIFVTGAGSLWANGAGMTLGSAGSFNQLVVSNGAVVRAVGLVTVGNTAIATNNSVLAVGGSLASVGLTLGNTVSRNNSVMLLSNSTWNIGGGTFVWGNAGINDTLAIDATSALTNIGALTLDENSTAFFLTNAPGSYSLNGWTTNQFQFKPGGLGIMTVGNSGNNVRLSISDHTLANTIGIVGNSGGANSNFVLVTGASSVWSNSSTLTIGNSGAFNQLVVSNGAVVHNTTATVGSSANSNLVLVTGVGSVWSNSANLVLGGSGTFNRLVISDGGMVANTSAGVGFNPGVSGNVVLVTDAGSRWNNSGSFTLGSAGSFNQLVISNGALVANSIGYLGFNSSSSTNDATVTGAGSLWNNRSDLYVGNSGIGNRLVINASGVVIASNAVYLGFNSTSSNNLLTVGGGGLIVTNPAGNGVVDIRRGICVLNSGAMDADRLLLTNSQGLFTFNGGTLKIKTTTNNNGQLFTAGNGTTLAAFELVGNGVHTFANGLTISSGALLKGNGNINGMLTVTLGATVSPGASVGKIVLNTPPALHGTVVMEISKNGASLTNDQIQVAGALAYGGSLTVSNLGPDTLALGNSFPLFSAASYSGALAAITLPTLPAGLSWTNQLLVNGSIAVVNKTAPRISGVAKNGANLIFNVMGGSPGGVWNLLTATNVALPIASWTTNSSGLFDWQGSVTLTNGISLTEPQRFFLINTP